MSLQPSVIKQVMCDLNDLRKNPIEGISVSVGEDVCCIEGEIMGPCDTPFEGGVFQVRLQLEQGYPQVPPKGYFLTKIFHPNVSEPKGEICVNTLKKDWEASMGLRHVFLVIRCLLVEPNPESALNEEAGKLLLEQYSEYCKRARLFTSIHAKPADAKENISKAESGCKDEKRPGVPLAAKAINKERKKSLKRL
eukprot:TRINITY_DN18328_c0_g1_i1.p2 TRINITY_DN18328_c0_g1~~TRINITY_DN18328_c0_g1_i1.p2  ORF type:complete len:194 (+),score=63.35 TRINITY_DN18328_c0_g1_i1:58-639(+)